MNLRFLFLVCFILAARSFAKSNKLGGWHKEINKLSKELILLKTNFGHITSYKKGLVILNRNLGRMITGIHTNINTLSQGVHFFNGLNKGIITLNKMTYKMLIPLVPVGLDCADICKRGVYPSGVYKISPNRKTTFKVYCDMKTAGGGWTVFQKRVDGSVDFYRTWNEYKRGFGNAKKNFWLGNDKLNLLTHITGRTQKLRVDLWDKRGNTRYAQYSKFIIGAEAKKYKLTVGSYSGNAGNSLSSHNGGAFTTKDRDNDAWSKGNCAVSCTGAWWYKNCHQSNLNGKYAKNEAKGVIWSAWKGFSYSMPHTEMKIRPISFNGCKT